MKRFILMIVFALAIAGFSLVLVNLYVAGTIAFNVFCALMASGNALIGALMVFAYAYVGRSN